MGLEFGKNFVDAKDSLLFLPWSDYHFLYESILESDWTISLLLVRSNPYVIVFISLWTYKKTYAAHVYQSRLKS